MRFLECVILLSCVVLAAFAVAVVPNAEDERPAALANLGGEEGSANENVGDRQARQVYIGVRPYGGYGGNGGGFRGGYGGYDGGYGGYQGGFARYQNGFGRRFNGGYNSGYNGGYSNGYNSGYNGGYYG